MRDLSDHLPALRADFPGYLFGVAHTWYGLSIIATRVGAGDGPYLVISSDVRELRRCLAASG
jgi:hypothetical protein